MINKEYLGELVGTAILVFFGCSSVAVAILFGALTSLFEVAIAFGLSVSLAIYASRSICPAHLNPAVSFAMWHAGKLPVKKLPFYILSQLLGAIVGGIVLYFIFSENIEAFETTNAIVRGSTESVRSGMMFGEYFPNPGFPMVTTSLWHAAVMEGVGTFVLVLIIFKLTERDVVSDNFIPLMIGLTVTLLICIIAPFTQGGFNPARDFGPRLVAYFAGWKQAAFPSIEWSFLSVYILSPMLGGLLASITNKKLLSVVK